MNKNNIKNSQEWHKQSLYDLKSAEVMFRGGRYIYSIFFCHLAVEKTLKSLYVKKFGKNPPRTHNLLYFVNTLNIKTDKKQNNIIVKLNEASIPTRYPEDLKTMLKEFNRTNTGLILTQTRGLLKWLLKAK